jgi:hypothetical protein
VIRLLSSRRKFILALIAQFRPSLSVGVQLSKIYVSIGVAPRAQSDQILKGVVSQRTTKLDMMDL